MISKDIYKKDKFKHGNERLHQHPTQELQLHGLYADVTMLLI